MTDKKEVIAYAISHLGGYIASIVVSQLVLVPLLMATATIGSPLTRYGAFFLLFVAEQVLVFFAFIAIRGRRVAA